MHKQPNSNLTGTAETQSERRQQKLKRVATNLFRSDLTNIYYGVFKNTGGQVKQSLDTTDPQIARARLAELRQKVYRRTSADAKNLPFAVLQDRNLVGGLAQQWLSSKIKDLKIGSQQAYQDTIRYLAIHFPYTVRGITVQHVANWRANCQLKPRGLNFKLFVLKSILDYAVTNGMILNNPATKFKQLKVEKQKRRIPTKDECRALLADMRSRSLIAADAVEFMALSGCRVSEAIGKRRRQKPPLLWGQVNFSAGTVTFLDTKTEPERTIPMFAPLRELLLRMRNELKTPPAASTPVFNMADCIQAIQRTTRKLGLPKFSDHDFRKFFITNCIEANIDLFTIARWVGHANLKEIMEVYGQLRNEHSQDMAKKVTFSTTPDDKIVDIIRKPNSTTASNDHPGTSNDADSATGTK